MKKTINVNVSNTDSIFSIPKLTTMKPIEIIKEGEKELDELYGDDFVGGFKDKLKFHIRSTQIALIKSQIEQEEGRKIVKDNDIRCGNSQPKEMRIAKMKGYNAAKDDSITDMKALLAELEK